MDSPKRLSIHALPLASSTLQARLTQLTLAGEPSAQRRSTTFKSSTRGVWARTNPLWAAWPLRVTKEEVQAMGVDIEKGEKVTVDDVLGRWDPNDDVAGAVTHNGLGDPGGEQTQLQLKTSKHRDGLKSSLLGISPGAVKDCLPHLDIGDSSIICNEGAEPTSSDSENGKAREDLINVLSGRHVLVSPDGKYGPWSTRYCGHQFGTWAGQLGDGRAISLLETESSGAGRMEIQLKGAGRTPFSRTADGLAVLRSGVREFLGCEAIAALGIPTTRSLALLTTPGLPVFRETGPEPPSLLARLAPSFIRIGHYEALNPGEAGRSFSQIFLGGGWAREDENDGETKGPLGGQGNLEGLRELVAWGKEVLGLDKGISTKEFVKEVARRNAEMVGQWQVYGWMHGVLNTDNISILGLTIDFGPYAFMDVYDEGHICNHSDPSGLYSYRRQPERVLFALDKLVSALGPLIGYEQLHGVDSVQEGWSEEKTAEDVNEWMAKSEESMKGWEEEYWAVERETEKKGWLKRFGLKVHKDSDDRDVFYDFLILLHTHSIDFHGSFRRLSEFKPSQTDDERYLRIFAADFVADNTISLPSDSVDPAIRDIKQWLEGYAKRVRDEDELKAWKGHSADATEIARVGGGEAGGEIGWEEKRTRYMRSVNPLFVLRQWVLEEVISELEDSLDDLPKGRKTLARVLDLSTNPFRSYGEDHTEEGKERLRLCGLGKKEMLGFQCSCSS